MLALVTVAYSFLVTLALLKVTDLAVGLWVGAKEEGEGLDLSQHGEVGYRLSDLLGMHLSRSVRSSWKALRAATSGATSFNLGG